jgi:hypothetical protein
MANDFYFDSLRANQCQRIEKFLEKISYKPGWNIRLQRIMDDYSITLVCIYNGYDNSGGHFEPVIPESVQVTTGRRVLSRSLGMLPEPQYFKFTRTFDSYQLEHMNDEAIIKYVIAGTLKEAEMYEFERWFKYDGIQVFHSGR